MGKYDIDKEIVRQLLDYSDMIANTYNELYTLEIEGKKNTKYYNSLVGVIKSLKANESKVYNEIEDDKLDEYLKYFSMITKEFLESKAPISKKLFSSQPAYLPIRIVNILEQMAYEYENSIEDDNNIMVVYTGNPDDVIDPEEMNENMQVISSDNTELIEKFNEQMEKSNNLNKFEDTIIPNSIIILDELGTKCDNSELKEDLMKTKYLNAFTAPTIEDSYLSCNFKLNINMINTYYKNFDYIVDCAYECSIIQIKNIIKKEVSDDPKRLIFNLSLLKAYALFLSDELVVDLINKLYHSDYKHPKKVKTKIIDEMHDVLRQVSK